MPVNKVVYGSQTIIDLTDSTLSSASDLMSGVTTYDRGGNLLTGTGVAGSEWTSGIYLDEDGYIRVSPEAAAGGIGFANGYIILDDKIGLSFDDGLYLDPTGTLIISDTACDITDAIIRDETLILPPDIFPKSKVYSVTENLTYTTSSNILNYIEEDSGLIIDLDADFSCLSGRMTSITVTMGGVDITNDVFYPDGSDSSGGGTASITEVANTTGVTCVITTASGDESE